MKLNWLLIIVLFIFVGYGTAQINLFTGVLYAPPGPEGPMELFYGSPGNLIAAFRTISNSERKAGEFRYEFSIPSGTYPMLVVIGHGSIPASGLLFKNVFGSAVTEIQNPICIRDSTEIYQVHAQAVVLPSGSILQLLAWMVQKGWLCFVLACSILLIKEIATRTSWLDSCRRSLLDLYVWSNSSALRMTTILMLLLSFLFLVPGAIRYDVADDSAMEMLASGYVTGHPSEYLVFIHFLPGLVLKGLYLLCPSVPWYPILLTSVTLTGIFIVTYVIQRYGPPNARLLWSSLFLVSCAANLVMHLQFTHAAFLLGFGGLLIFIFYRSKASLVLSLMLVISCSLLRYESFILLAITFLPAAFCFTERPKKARILYGIIMIISVLGLKEMNRAYYFHDQAWGHYVEYNQARGELHQTPKINDVPANEPVFKKVQWSKNDREMFGHYWLFQDSRVYSLEKLKYLATHLIPIQDIRGCFFALLLPIIRLSAAVLFFLFIISLGIENTRSCWKRVILIIAPSFILFGYLVLFLRLPDRVVLPTLCACIVFFLIYIPPRILRTKSLVHSFNAALLISIVLTFSISTIAYTCKQRMATSQQLQHSLDCLRSVKDKTLVSSINSIRLEDLEPFSNLSVTSGLDVIHLMWSFESPSFNLQLSHHHSGELFSSLARDPHFLLVVPTIEIERGQAFADFMQEHYGETLQMTPFKMPDGSLAIFPDITVLQSSEAQAQPEGAGQVR